MNGITAGRVKDEKSGSIRRHLAYFRKNAFLYTLLMLPLAYLALFRYGPMYGVLMAFQDYDIFKGITGSKWVGLDVFKFIFQQKDFFRALKNTFLLNFLDLVVGFPAPIILALLLNELRMVRFKKISQTVLYLPHFLSWVIIGGMTYLLFSSNGMVNSMLMHAGIPSVDFLSNKYNWLALYIFIGVWQNAGWGTILYLAAMTSISRELYEAAEADGANRLRRIWHITLPGIRPTIVTLLILQLGRMAAIGFDRPFVLGNSLVKEFSEVISTYVYRVGLQSSDFSQATAVGLFQSVVGLVFLIAADAFAKKVGEEGIW